MSGSKMVWTKTDLKILASWMLKMRRQQPWARVLFISGVIVGLAALFLGGRGSPVSPPISAQFVPRQVIEGPYWNLEPGFDSSLMLSNTSDEPNQ